MATSLGAQLVESRFCTAYSADKVVPFCNFAIGFDGDREDARSLREMLRAYPMQRVFLMTGDQPTGLFEIVIGSGFAYGNRLSMMAHDGDRLEGEVLEPEKAADRLEAADFIGRSFFGGPDSQFKLWVVEATVRSGYDLWVIRSKGDIIAAAMTADEPGTLGLYNLCVLPSYRRQGIGSGIVRFLTKIADFSGKLFTLQCESALSEWYHALQFIKVGEVTSYHRSVKQN